MNPTTRLILLAFSSTCLTSSGATFAGGYTVGSSSQLLTTNGGAASVLFVDEALTGGGDLRTDGGNPDYGWVIDGSSSWDNGYTVSFTGLALPVWANDPTTDATNNTQNGTFTFTFYSTGANNTWNGTNNLGTSDDSLIGTIDITFDSAGLGVDEYYADFDSALNWTADSSSIFFTLQSTGALRLKVGFGPSAIVPRAQESTGSALGASAVTLAGIVTVPEPSTAILGIITGMTLLRRRRQHS